MAFPAGWVLMIPLDEVAVGIADFEFHWQIDYDGC